MLFGLMVIAQSAFSATFGLVVVFFVILPVIAQGLIAFAAAQAAGERSENEEYRSATGVTEDQRI